MSKKATLSQALVGFDRRASRATPAQTDETLSPRTSAPSREGKRAIAGFFRPEVSRQLKMLSAETDTSIQDLLAEALNLLFEKHGRSPIA